MKFIQLFKTTVVFSLLVFLAAPTLAASGPPFFLMGDGHLKIKNLNNNRSADVRLLKQDGSLNEEAFLRIDFVLGFPTREKGEHISLRTLFMLDHFSDHFAPGKTVYIKSGYRSPVYNQNLRKNGRTAAKTSTHIDGMALDFYIEGVDGKQMWEYIRARDCCGVGYYGGRTVHLDSGRPRFWEQTTSQVWSGASDYNRFIYLSTEFDRYALGDKIRLFYTSISDFGFGIDPTAVFVTDKEGKKKAAKAKIATPETTKCLMINKRKDARFLYTQIPQTLKPGRYRIRIDFCKRSFEEMPKNRVSNVIKVVPATKL